MKKRIEYLMLLGIILLALFLRMYRIDTAPKSALIDEADFGYNAFSLLKTGNDEHGNRFPLTFEAFGDEKLPVFGYLLIPFVHVFGLSVFSVRFASVVVSIFGIVGIFFLLRELRFSSWQSLVGVLVFAVSPWSLTLSRFGYESNVGVTFFICGFLFLLLSFRKHHIIFFALSGICLGLTLYTYVAFRFFTPLFLFIFFLIQIVKNRKTTFRNSHVNYGVFICVFLVFMIPISSNILTISESARSRQVGLISDQSIAMTVNENRNYCSEHFPQFPCFASFNKVVIIGEKILHGYANVFSVDYLFLNGEREPKHISTDSFGLFPSVAIIFYGIGLIHLVNTYFKEKNFRELLVLTCLLFAPLPAILSFGQHRIRLAPLLPFLIIVIVSGFAFLEIRIKNAYSKKIITLLYCLICLLFVLQGLHFLFNYTSVHVAKYDVSFSYPFPEMMEFIDSYGNDPIVYFNGYTEAITYYAFYTRFDPQIFQNDAIWSKPNDIGFQHPIQIRHVQNTEFEPEFVYCKNVRVQKPILYVTKEDLGIRYSIEAEKSVTTSNGVHVLARIYDLQKFAKRFDCSKFL